MILRQIRAHAFLTGGLRFTIMDERAEGKAKVYEFFYEQGVKSFVNYLNLDEKTVGEAFMYKPKMRATLSKWHSSTTTIWMRTSNVTQITS